MAKGYWVVAWRSISDQAAFERYVPPAAAAIHAHGGREIARGLPAKAYEQGLLSRLVVIEFDSLKLAVAAYESPDYQAAASHLAGVAERDVRIVEGVS